MVTTNHRIPHTAQTVPNSFLNIFIVSGLKRISCAYSFRDKV
jgi:hypothetical protein